MTVLACGGSPSQPARWEALPGLPTGPQQETAVASLGTRLYVLGGFDENRAIQASLDLYDTATEQWTSVTPAPSPLHHANLVAADGRLFVLGYLSGDAFTAMPDVLVYDPPTDTWSSRTPMPTARARGAAAIGVIGRTVHVAGGYRAGSLAEHDVYLLDEDRWETRADLPQARDHVAGAAIAGTLYVLGGRADVPTDRVDAYDPATDTWSSRAPMPTGRAGAATAVVDDTIIIAGGEGNGAVASGVFSQVEAYDPASDTWTALPDMLTPRHGTGAAAINGRVYVPGGATVQGFGAVDTFEVLIP